jgi:hypothetical protein
MNSYKYNDDIFRKATIVPDGKNHGMIMYLDWSGSMHHDMFNTIEQTLNLVYFCRQVNIPFRVYAFTNKWELIGAEGIAERTKFEDRVDNTPTGYMLPDPNYRLLEFFNNKMNKMQFARMTKVLLGLGKHISGAHTPFRLGGTPLDNTVAIAPKVYDLFQKVNKVDVVNTVFLTDGDSHSMTFVNEREYYDGTRHKYLAEITDITGWRFDNRKILNINDTVAKKKYRVTGETKTKVLLKNYAHRTGSNVIGYRIMSGNKFHAIRDFENFGFDWSKSNQLWEDLKKEKYLSVPGVGYSKFFILKGGKDLETANGSFQVASDAKKGQILTAFKKANKSKLVSRSLLNEFIKEVA